MLRKIRRNMARNQLKKEGYKKINKKRRGDVSLFSSEWKRAYVRGIAEILRKNGHRVVVRRAANESKNS